MAFKKLVSIEIVEFASLQIELKSEDKCTSCIDYLFQKETSNLDFKQQLK